MPNVAVIGAQWGDEGKGKVVDWLASRADMVVRFQGPGIEHHAIADDGRRTAHDPARQKRQFVDLVADDQSVAGIVAALKAHDHVGTARQPVDDLALAFVTPLGADDGHISHDQSSVEQPQWLVGSKRPCVQPR